MIKFCSRHQHSITSAAGQKSYYDHLNHWRVCYDNTKPLIVPTQEDALAYLRLKAEKDKFYFCNDKASRRKNLQLKAYETQYDWRPLKFGDGTSVGLISPIGEQLLADSFADVFTQFDAINDKPEFIPVSNGEAWALVSLTNPNILMTGFQYNAIIPERWERKLFFVQDKKTLKWGAFRSTYPFLNIKHYRNTLPLLELIMPPIADEIYEDELMTEDAPTIFFMSRRGDKIGILTNFGYSDIMYDSYEADNSKCSFLLMTHAQKRVVHYADYWHPNPRDYNKFKAAIKIQ
ncbi:MAG: hypothetical protein K2K97_09230 [Muribaculaceae bacterium]|nr:hypothetical protein [Muribaculaceae bacterium]